MNSNLLLLVGLVVAVTVSLASCSTQLQIPDRVNVRVPVACVDPADRPKPPPTRSPSDLLAMDRYRRTLATWSDLAALRAYAAELEALVEGCSRLPAER